MTYERAVSYLCGVAGLSDEKTEISTTVRYLKKAARKKKKQQLPVTHPILDEKILNDFEHRRITKWIEEGIPQSIMENMVFGMIKEPIVLYIPYMIMTEI